MAGLRSSGGQAGGLPWTSPWSIWHPLLGHLPPWVPCPARPWEPPQVGVKEPTVHGQAPSSRLRLKVPLPLMEPEDGASPGTPPTRRRAGSPRGVTVCCLLENILEHSCHVCTCTRMLYICTHTTHVNIMLCTCTHTIHVYTHGTHAHTPSTHACRTYEHAPHTCTHATHMHTHMHAYTCARAHTTRTLQCTHRTHVHTCRTHEHNVHMCTCLTYVHIPHMSAHTMHIHTLHIRTHTIHVDVYTHVCMFYRVNVHLSLALCIL